MKKGFTLIELLAVMVVLAILIIFVAPNIVGRLNDSKKEIFKTEMISLMKSAEQEYQIDKAKYLRNYSYGTGSLLVNTSDDIEYCVILNGDGSINNITVVDNNKRFKGTGTSEKDLTVTEINSRESINCEVLTNNAGTVGEANYRETLLHGTDPVLKGDLIPVILSQDATDGWKVTYADTKEEWYKYAESRWANAVRLIAEPSGEYEVGDVIDHDDISAYFVWIPRYKYKLFNMGNYTDTTTDELTPANQLIDIVFGTETTVDTLSSCATPMKSGESGTCAVGKYMTHPAFISFNSDGFWVGKFETTGTTDKSNNVRTINLISVLPNSNPITSVSVDNIFENAYNYKRTLDSHMMKNTEWGAVAYLSHSVYGIGNVEIWQNNMYDLVTGCVGNKAVDSSSSQCSNKWYSSKGNNGSTSGNITGIYDMSGGAWEYVASYKKAESNDVDYSSMPMYTVSQYNNKYYDIYDEKSGRYTFNYRILGDGTGEMGPFKYNDNYYSTSIGLSSWYNDRGLFVWNPYRIFFRGGCRSDHIDVGIFSTSNGAGSENNSIGFRLVLTPQ